MTRDPGQAAALVAGDAAECVRLWPFLAGALERDHQPGGRAPAGEAGMPVNGDVLACMSLLCTAIPAMDIEARRALGQARWRGSIPQRLAAAEATWAQLVARPALAPVAAEYAHALAAWARAMRRALGLTRPARPIGWPCPLHDQPAGLLLAGDEGHPHPGPGGRGQVISWRVGDTIACPGCGATWQRAAWPLLGRLLEQRKHEQQQQEQEGQK